MKVNILNKLIVDPETIERVDMISEPISRKKSDYSIYFLFKDRSHYSICYGTVSQKDSIAKNEIKSRMESDIEKIYNLIK